MQGNCEGVGAPFLAVNASHADLLGLLPPRQCLILADYNLMLVKCSNLWLDGLYVRLTSPRLEFRTDGYRPDFSEFIRVDGSCIDDTQVWMTNMTLQGNQGGNQGVPYCEDCGLTVRWSGGVYAEGTSTDCHHSDCLQAT